MPENDILSWLMERLSSRVSRPVAEISPHVPYEEYGLDSVAALGLFGDIEERFGLCLEPSVAWEYPTAAAMAQYIAEESAPVETKG